MAAASIWEKGCKSLNGGQVSCRTGENLGFTVKNKREQILASGNASVCLSHSIKRPEKRLVHHFYFLSLCQLKHLVKLLVGNQCPMWCWQSDCIDHNGPWFLTKRVINYQSISVRDRRDSYGIILVVLVKRGVSLKDRLELGTEVTVLVQMFLGADLPCWGQLTLRVPCRLLKTKIKAKALQSGSFSLFSSKITEKEAVCLRQHIHSYPITSYPLIKDITFPYKLCLSITSGMWESPLTQPQSSPSPQKILAPSCLVVSTERCRFSSASVCASWGPGRTSQIFSSLSAGADACTVLKRKRHVSGTEPC